MIAMETDEDVTNTYYQDQDLDGYGNPDVSIETRERPPGPWKMPMIVMTTTVQYLHPTQKSVMHCGQQLDGQIDEEGAVFSIWYFDNDLDGLASGTGVLACSAPTDHVSNTLDCDDSDTSISPNATEICDGGDNDCNGLSDDQDGGVSNASVWYLDYDQDGYGGS